MENELLLNIFNNKKIKAIKCEDEEFPRIDIYLEQAEPKEFLLIASIEDNKESGLRVISYNDLSDDEPTAILPVK